MARAALQTRQFWPVVEHENKRSRDGFTMNGSEGTRGVWGTPHCVSKRLLLQRVERTLASLALGSIAGGPSVCSACLCQDHIGDLPLLVSSHKPAWIAHSIFARGKARLTGHPRSQTQISSTRSIPMTSQPPPEGMSFKPWQRPPRWQWDASTVLLLRQLHE